MKLWCVGVTLLVRRSNGNTSFLLCVDNSSVFFSQKLGEGVHDRSYVLDDAAR